MRFSLSLSKLGLQEKNIPLNPKSKYIFLLNSSRAFQRRFFSRYLNEEGRADQARINGVIVVRPVTASLSAKTGKKTTGHISDQDWSPHVKLHTDSERNIFLLSSPQISTAARASNALSTIKDAVSKAIAKERRMAASLIRLHFHDCFVQGCDGSVLLKDSATFTGEQTALQNFRSVRGFNVVDDIKSVVERVCPDVVSCADILVVASCDASKYVGGPSWTLKLGRRDSKMASKALAEANLPIAFDDVGALISYFARQGLSARDMVALSGAHTIGMAQCVTFRGRVYNDTIIDASFASTRRRSCPAVAGNGDGNLAPLDLVTPSSFDNNYFKNLLRNKGLLHSDQALFNGGSSGTESIVSDYACDRALFYSDFAAAMVKMGDISPLTGTKGKIRKICGAIN